MKTTIEISDDLINEAMKVTKVKSRKELFKLALQDIIRKSKIQGIKSYKGKIDIDVDLDNLRKRNIDIG